MNYLNYTCIILALVLTSSSCKKDNLKANFKSQVQGNSEAAVSSLQNLNIASDELRVIELPQTVDSKIRGVFKWYTKVMAPNGKPIHLLAQSNWSKEKVAYTRTVLEHYLTTDLSLIYGNKANVANSIATNNGAMTMFNDANSVANNTSGVNGQDLQSDETVAVGSPEYLALSVRNAALEEILHFVHDLGLSPVYPQFQKELEVTTVNAMDNQIFTPWSGLPVADYDNELLAAYNDVYWGLTEHRTTVDNPYLFLSREAAEAGDILTTNLMHKTLPTYFTSTQIIASSFQGTFYLTKTNALPYTNQSQYYKNVKLIGANNSSIIGNNMDNNLIGNTGNNEFIGGKGNDTIDGKGGNDKVKFSGVRTDYTVSKSSGITTIIDNTPNRDGTTTLTNNEEAIFTDQSITL